MKPQEHISPESWRHEDAALRRALQQRNNALPQLPEGFADQIQTQLSESVQALQSESVQTQLPAQPAADSSKHSHRLLLWPMIAAAVVIIALFINLPSLIHEQPEHDELVQAPERPVIHSTQEFPTQAPNRPSITHTPERPLIAQTTNRSSSITATPQSGTTAAPQSGTTATPHSGTSATPQSENAPLPESISTPVVGGSSADTPADTPANNPPTSTISSPTSPSPSITVQLGEDGLYYWASTSPSPSPLLPPAPISPSTTPTTTLLPPPTKIPPQRLPTHIIPTTTNTTSPQARATPTPSNLPPAVATIPETLALPQSATSKKPKLSTRANTAYPSPPR